MYQFTDIIDKGTRDTSMSIQTIFNGTNLDNALTDNQGYFKTLTVEGRGFLPRRIPTYQTPGMHGARESDYTYDVREITVNFLISDETNTGFRERLNQLNGMLIENKKELRFTDEDAYFIATFSGGSLPAEDSNILKGSLTFLCSNPAKMMDEHTITITSSYKTEQIKGQRDTPWTTETTFTKTANQFTFEGPNNLFIRLDHNFVVGDVLKIDYHYRKVTLNGSLFMKAISLQTNWVPLQVGFGNFKASHKTKLTYSERYY